MLLYSSGVYKETPVNGTGRYNIMGQFSTDTIARVGIPSR